MKTKLFIFILLTFCSSMILAQSLYMKDFCDGRRSLNLIFNRVNIDGVSNGTLSGSFRLYYIQPINRSLSLEGMIAYQNNDYDKYYSKSGIGNIYLGINKISESGKSNFSAGIYIPTMSTKTFPNYHSALYGTYDFGNYYYNAVVLRGNYSYQNISEAGLLLGFEAGPDLVIATEKNFNDDVIVCIHAAAKIGFSVNNFRIFGEISNVTNVSEEINEFKNRFINHWGIGASYISDNYEFGLSYANTFENMYKLDNGIGFNFKFFGF